MLLAAALIVAQGFNTDGELREGVKLSGDRHVPSWSAL
ncbi:hypothetical protein BN159_p93 (plasmid) [Streptomyces davaonensis JCM 4913]|uniref:Uncharacterized protein n=1 Tax=Streptomyces davaonensis (strain DSM 101723 / JCM 4913 / KCC S-0913 / 768) TaxID=1214101 RepID=K4RGR2_STRDJ|nr:hypothetical protein BN159_p93 [Streptomyces davaonensis JCM 4913]